MIYLRCSLREHKQEAENSQIMKKLMTLLCGVLILGMGCAKPHRPDAVTLQATWKGHEVGPNAKGEPTMTLDGTTMDFKGADPREWYKGTYTLHEDTNPKQMVIDITDCPMPQFVGKRANAIYKIEDGTLTIASFQPGTDSFPPDFDAPKVRKIVFKAK
jgi:uncharacterized protein (TIGR03067 family)